MKFYVASRFSDFHKARWVMNELRKLGHEITYDWTNTDEFNEFGEHHRVEGAVPRETLIKYALLDIKGVQDADVFVLCDSEGMAGAWTEMGIALRYCSQIWCVSPPRWSIFMELPIVTKFSSYRAMFEHARTL